MPIEISSYALRRLSDCLELLDEDEFFLVVSVLSDLGIAVIRSRHRGFLFESSLTYAKRRIVEELKKALTPKGTSK